MTLIQCAITLKDPSSVSVWKGILKVDSINVQVTPHDLLIETLRYFETTSWANVSTLTISLIRFFWATDVNRK